MSASALILNELGENPTMAKMLSAASKLDRIVDERPTIRFSVLRNITVEPGLPAAIKVLAAKNGLRAVVELGDFDTAQQEVLDSSSALYARQPDIIIIVLRLQTIAPRLVLDFAALRADEIERLTDAALARITGLIDGIRARSTATILVHNFEMPMNPAFGILDAQLAHGQSQTIRSLNAEIARFAARSNACFVVDVDRLLSVAGYEASLDDRYWHIGRAPYSFHFLECLAGEYVKFAAALKGKTKKCLVLDCDNTLWGGVVGEEGPSGIKLGSTYPGSAFVEFQAAILDLYNRGTLLAINSKNNHADVLAVLESHPDSLLRPDHFVNLKINWDDKVTNLRAIAAELNIGLDSLVFVDDNAFECQYVREQLPEVTVIELPSDVTRYARLLRSLGGFDALAISDEDRRRSEMYRSEARRFELKSSAGTMDDYLASLEMVLTIARGSTFSIPRIAQLTQKTNQFNLTTRRYSEGDIAQMVADSSWRVYYAELEDKFDKAGIIAVALVHDEGGVARIDTYLMSCRVIGRGVEQALLAQIAHDSAEMGIRSIVGEFLPTAKNQLVSKFYESASFIERAGSDRQWWELSIQGNPLCAPTWFREIRVVDAMVAV
jgi:FkbH-like protein